MGTNWQEIKEVSLTRSAEWRMSAKGAARPTTRLSVDRKRSQQKRAATAKTVVTTTAARHAAYQVYIHVASPCRDLPQHSCAQLISRGENTRNTDAQFILWWHSFPHQGFWIRVQLILIIFLMPFSILVTTLQLSPFCSNILCLVPSSSSSPRLLLETLLTLLFSVLLLLLLLKQLRRLLVPAVVPASESDLATTTPRTSTSITRSMHSSTI